jgi:hypothetical protein
MPANKQITWLKRQHANPIGFISAAVKRNYDHLCWVVLICYICNIKEEIKMFGVKQEVIKMIQSLPNEVTIDDIMAELYFKSQVDAGLKELDEGKGIPHEEVEKRMSKWLSK